MAFDDMAKVPDDKAALREIDTAPVDAESRAVRPEVGAADDFPAMATPVAIRMAS